MNSTQSELDAIADRIRLEPPPAKMLTNKEKIKALKPELKAAISRGHTAASLSSLLAADGLKIAPRALSTMLQLTTRREKAQKPAPDRAGDTQ